MASINGYKYTTEQEAIAAQTSCDEYYNIVPKEGNIAQHWTGYNYSTLDNFYYIAADPSLIPVLGEPIEFDLTLPEMN